MKRVTRLVIASLFAIILSACGGSQSPDTTPAPPNSNTGVTLNPLITTCDSSRMAEHFCNKVAISPAPPAAGATVANPGVNGVQDCEADWDTSQGTTDIAMTVFIPPHDESEKLPLILHSHGWGGARAKTPAAADPTASSNTFQGIADMTQRLWREGYIVISFDQRGWGGSTGEAQVIDPCYETADAMALVDWAIANLPVDTSDGDIVLGAIGGSYGGAYQMMLAAMDDRLDAIMPVATWNSLANDTNALLGSPTTVDASTLHSSLITNEVVKKGYVQGLCLLANIAPRDNGAPGGATRDLRINQACTAIQTSAKAGKDLDNAPLGSPALRELFASNGMVNPNLRPGRPPMNVDVFLAQGMRDMVFDAVEAYDNYQFFTNPTNNSASADVRFMTTDGGHMLTTFEQVMGVYPASPPDYQVQGDNDCGTINMFEAMVSWFDEKLKNQSPAITIPDICIALDSDDGVQLPNIPLGNSLGNYTLPSTEVSATTALNLDIIGSPRLFVPLTTMTTDGFIAGIPVFDNVKIDAVIPSTPPPLPVPSTVVPTGLDATGFVAIGIERADGTLVEVDEQVAGIRRANEMTDPAITYNNLRLPMVADKLNTGDKVGLLLYSSNGYYQLNPGANIATEYMANAYAISGEIQIPIFDTGNNLILP